jgi:hypothetical protein
MRRHRFSLVMDAFVKGCRKWGCVSRVCVTTWKERSSMALRLERFGVRSRKLSSVGQSLDGWPKIYPQTLTCFSRHVKRLVLAVFAVVSTHQSALGSRGGLWPFLLMYILHKKGFCPSSGEINKLIMTEERDKCFFLSKYQNYKT